MRKKSKEANMMSHNAHTALVTNNFLRSHYKDTFFPGYQANQQEKHAIISPSSHPLPPLMHQ